MTEARDWTVDPGNPLPLYYQVYASLLQRIQGGEFPPGSFLPAERQLTEDYGVSRITIIKALNELSREHHIKRQQGRGTVVTHPAERPATERGSIAFICHVLDHPYLFHVLMGIARTAAENHRNPQVISSNDPADGGARHVKEDDDALNFEGDPLLGVARLHVVRVVRADDLQVAVILGGGARDAHEDVEQVGVVEHVADEGNRAPLRGGALGGRRAPPSPALLGLQMV